VILHDHEPVLDHGIPGACPPAQSSVITSRIMITAIRAADARRGAVPPRALARFLRLRVFAAWHQWKSLLVGNTASVTLLTWVVMPVVTRALRFWLLPGNGRAGSRLDAIGAAISIAFLAFAAAVVLGLYQRSSGTYPDRLGPASAPPAGPAGLAAGVLAMAGLPRHS
jgi:hypothetical protein